MACKYLRLVMNARMPARKRTRDDNRIRPDHTVSENRPCSFPLLSWGMLVAGCRAKEPITPMQQDCVECALREHEPTAAPNATVEFARGCSEGDPRSCSILAVMYEQGRGGLLPDSCQG